MKNAALIAAALASSIGAACCSPKSEATAAGHVESAPSSRLDLAAVAKSWRTTERNPSNLMGWSVGLPPGSVSDVAAGSLTEAVELLGSVEWRALSPEQAAAMAASRIEGAGIHYLLRGVDMAHGEDPIPEQSSDKLKVFDVDGVVTVQVRGFRLERFDLRPRPVIALLSAEPKRLFVEPRYSISMIASEGEESLKRGH